MQGHWLFLLDARTLAVLGVAALGALLWLGADALLTPHVLASESSSSADVQTILHVLASDAEYRRIAERVNF